MANDVDDACWLLPGPVGTGTLEAKAQGLGRTEGLRHLPRLDCCPHTIVFAAWPSTYPRDQLISLEARHFRGQ